MRTFSQAERACEASFSKAGPYWHAYTSGKNTPIIFATEADLKFVMNVIAQAAILFKPICDAYGCHIGGLLIITFEVMNNHLHFVVSGEEEIIRAFFDYIRKRLKRTIPNANLLDLQLKPIETLTALRNQIVYTNRNGYVAFSDYTPFSYPWGSGRYYYNEIPLNTKSSDYSVTQMRDLFRGRAPEIPENYLMIDDYVAPSSYCAIKFGMSMFRDAHHYFYSLTKNVEAYSGVSADIDDDEFLTDAELFGKVIAIIRERYKTDSLNNLSKAQKIELAKVLRYEFHSSNGQIRRTLGLTQYEVDSLFPLRVNSR